MHLLVLWAEAPTLQIMTTDLQITISETIKTTASA